MTLIPKRPPGRPNRKALAFASEIGRLHRLGYSAEAIRQSLADAGLVVSRRTVTREVAKHPKHLQAAAVTREGAASLVPPAPAPASTAALSSVLSLDRRSGKEIAAAFMQGRFTNPLLRARTS